MIIRLRQSQGFRIFIRLLIIAILPQLLLPVKVLGLTGGPSQPEVQSFEPIGTSEMVDLITGDFNYNLPLLDVGGYPINLSYHSGITMDQEASWVGLGWNLNPGVINRGMRGMPDDFLGDPVKKEMNVKANKTWGGSLGIGDIEIVGGPTIPLSLDFGIFYNNYRGVGYEFGINPDIAIGDKQKMPLNIGLGLSMNSQQGIDVEPTIGLSTKTSKLEGNQFGSTVFSAKVGASYNSRSGLKALTFGASANMTHMTRGTEGKSSSGYTVPLNGGATIPTNLQTYVPQINMPMVNKSTTFHVGVGFEGKWINAKARLSGYYNEQDLMFKKQILPAFGYLYADRGQNVRAGLLDFNREKDGMFTKNTPTLPLTSQTYDILNVSGQGVGGMYRAYQASVGTVFDNQTFSFSTGKQIGGDGGAGDIAKFGLNLGFNFNVSSSGYWSEGYSSSQPGTSFKSPAAVQQTNKLYEPFYFKQAGELVVSDQNFHNDYGGKKPVRVGITKEGETQAQLYTPKDISGNTYPSGGPEDPLPLPGNYKTNREKRNQTVSVLAASEAKNFALEKKIKSYRFTDPVTGAETVDLSERDDLAPGHHISEVSVLKPEGSRYIYGIPAYNIMQREVTFNAVGQSVSCPDGTLTYTAGSNSTGNQNGVDNFFSATELPPYAHSYLLTTVLSTDYVDRTGNGASDDDFGTYTQFNYERKYDKNKPYRWRTPFQLNQANFNEGLKADQQDDKGSYVYGEKEIWHLHTIETKTHRAEFYTSPRLDGFGVAGENGGIDLSSPSFKLDSIKLFAKCDRRDSTKQAVLLKAVHFRYDYSLCQNVHNTNNTGADRGKLTLREVFFTYGNSLKGKLSAYRFTYNNFNPGYQTKAYDRWGYYKPNPATSCDPFSSPLSNSDFPYAVQDKTQADLNAGAWSLVAIDLPSGGRINIEYESDDYAYVQDKRAMQMCLVKGMSATPWGLSTDLFNGNTPHPYLRLDLPEAVANKAEFRKKYLEDENGTFQSTLYFRFLIDVIGRQGGSGSDPDAYEFVSGYAEIDSDEYDVNGTDAWIKLKTVSLGDRKGSAQVNPIAKTAWQFARLYLSKLVYPGSDPTGTGESAIRSLLGFATDLKTMFNGFNKTLRGWDFGRKMAQGKCMVRLYNPTWQKFGGGTRVKRLTISDNWSTMTNSGQDFEYGQQYEYTTIKEGSITAQNPDGIEISSGVAEYEPMIGNEENPWRQPLAYSDEHRLAPDDHFYQETPFGESFFPEANVGYSEVRVRNLERTDIKRHATGFVQHFFYTARDYPVYTRQTRLERLPQKPSWLKRILKVDVKDYMTASQGFIICLNDMHGKPKAQWVYPEYPAGTKKDEIKPISGVEYYYRTDPANAKRLNNRVSVIYSNGAIVTNTVGVEVDAVNDMREHKTRTMGFTFAGNLDLSTFPFPPIPLPIPSLWPSFTKEETRFRSITTTKVHTSYGILEKTVAHDLGSRVATENIAFDAETGETLLTKTTNGFNDPVYSFTYPAHWAYDGMGQAYLNIGAVFGGVSFANGVSSAITDAKSFFAEGDELAAGANKYWVTQVNTGNIQIVDAQGGKPSLASGTVKIIRSGRRNMASTPVGSVVSKTDPRAGGIANLSEQTQIISAEAVEFSDRWGTFCECGIDLKPRDGKFNPFLAGTQGNWRTKRNWVYLTNRDQASLNRNTYIRRDGNYSKFQPFWEYLGLGRWGPTTSTGALHDTWTFSSEVTLYSPFGFELENRDALGRHSAALYGHDNTLPTAVASNSKYSEIGFDGFEDYGCKTCTDDHFSFSKSTPAAHITTRAAHTGRHSIRLGPGEQVSITKILVNCEMRGDSLQ